MSSTEPIEISKRLLHNAAQVMEWYSNSKVQDELAEHWPNNELIKADEVKNADADALFKLVVYYGQFQQMDDVVVGKHLNDIKTWWNETLTIKNMREQIKRSNAACKFKFLESNQTLSKCVKNAQKLPSNKGGYLVDDDCKGCIMKKCEDALNRTKDIGAIPVSFVLEYGHSKNAFWDRLSSVNQSKPNKVYGAALDVVRAPRGIGEQVGGWILRSLCKGGTDDHLAAINDDLSKAILKFAKKEDSHVKAFLSEHIAGDRIPAGMFDALANAGKWGTAQLSQALYAFHRTFDSSTKFEKEKPKAWLYLKKEF